MTFTSIHYASEQFVKNLPNTQLFITDSNTEFPNIASTPYNATTGVAYVDSGFNWNQIVTYPTYLGNNTWGVSQPASPAPPPTATGTRHEILYTIPITESWFIDYVNVSIFLPTMPVNTRMYSTIYNAVQSNIASAGWFNYTFDFTTFQSLNLINGIIGNPEAEIYCLLSLAAPDGNTLPAHAYIFNVEIIGKLVTTWTLQDTINLIVGVSIGINIFIGVLMLDSVDFRAVRKDLPGITRKRTTKTKSKRKR